MAFKFISLFAIVAVASGSGLYDAAVLKPAVSYGAPLLGSPLVRSVAPVVTKEVEFTSRPQYSFGYDVKDGYTGDFKNHHESRDGDLVQGQYSLIDADGFKRTVDYSSDAIHGFNAVVSRQPLVAKKIIVPEAPIVQVVKQSLPVPVPAVVRSSPVVEPHIIKSVPITTSYAGPTLIKSSPLLSSEWSGYAPSHLNGGHLFRSYDDGQYRPEPTLVKSSYAGAFTGYGPTIIKSTGLVPAYDDGQYRPLQYQAPYESHYASKYGFVKVH